MIIRKLINIKELPPSHEDPKNPGSLKKIIFEKKEFPDKLMPQMINWARIPVGKKFNLHYHQDMVEIFIIIKGKVIMTVGNEKKILKVNEIVMVPAKSDHEMRNIGKTDALYYVIGLSSGMGGKTIIRT